MRLRSKIRSESERERERERSMIYVVWFWVGLICDQGVHGVQDLSQGVQKYF